MTAAPVALVCEGCGALPPPLPAAPYPFRCEHAGEDAIDHVLAPRIDPAVAAWPVEDDDRPFVRYRRLLHAHTAAVELGLGDAGYLATLEQLDRALLRAAGRSFRVTPLVRAPEIASALGLSGEVLVKDETGNVSGSHKGRHLFGVLLHLALVKRAGLEPVPAPPLAIASCGNAALAAAVLANAADRRLDVMVPPDAHPRVLARLRELGAGVHIRERAPGELGDPTVAAFRRAVRGGALPFACQGTDCGLTLDGGKTLGFELCAAGVPFDRIFVQIGGGALASSLARALDEAFAMGALPRPARLMTVQTEAVAPLARAYERLVAEVRARLPHESLPAEIGDALADRLRAAPVAKVSLEVLDEISRDRAARLPPWPSPRASAAHGILDDETYDAVAILRAMIATGGSPIVADEPTVLEAEALGRRATGIDADATGTSGLAGLIAWTRANPRPAPERIALLFTGIRR